MFLLKKQIGYQKKKAGLEKLRKFISTYIVKSIYIFIFNLKFLFLVEVITHCMLITPPVMYRIFYF